MRILGISEIDNDAGAALLEDDRIVGAVNEERFSRVKRHTGFPRASVAWLLEKGGITPRDLDAVVIVKHEYAEEMRRYREPLRRHRWLHPRAPRHEGALNWCAYRFYKTPKMDRMVRGLDGEIREWLSSAGIPNGKVFRYDHHRCHAASAYYTSGFDPALAVTVDGQGAGVSAAVYRCGDGKMERLGEVHHPNSMGVFYAAATKALGFKPARHEGKVTGLAGCGPPDPAALDMCRNLAFVNGGTFETPALYGAYPRMKRVLKRCGAVPFASAFQQVLEEVVSGFIARYLKETGLRSVVLAGGVFANVKLNQRVKELPGVERLNIFPHMCDGGLGVGGAYAYLADRDGCRPKLLPHVFLGPEYSEAEMEEAVRRSGLPYRREDDIARVIAKALSEGRIVARFQGALEFGPRALGNRSILIDTTDPSVNDWMNARLRRSEFMPFAPVSLPEHVDELYRNVQGAEIPAQFMTITFDCTDTMKKLSPAVVHVDGTARPQVVNPATNPDNYRIVKEYHALTGIPSLINTSFNMHEEPIVCTPSDAIRAFVQAGLDYLAIGPFLCRQAPSGSKGVREVEQP